MNFSDIEIAKKICHGHEKETEKIHKSFGDRILWKANEYVSHRKINDTFWSHEITKNKNQKKEYKKTIKVNDHVSNTYLFLIQYLIKKSCKYTGTSNASLDTYLTAVLNNKFTRNDWKKSEFGGLSIPKVIGLLSKDHQTIFKSLKHKEPIELMEVKVKKSRADTAFIIKEVKDALASDGKLDMVEDPHISDLVNEFNDEDREYDIIDNDSDNVHELSQASDIKYILIDCYSKLEAEDKKLIRLYWDARLTVNRIYEDYFKNNDPMVSFEKIIINKENDVYLNIKRVIQNFDKILQEHHYEFYEEGEFDIKKTTNALKIFVENYDSSSNNFWKNKTVN